MYQNPDADDPRRRPGYPLWPWLVVAGVAMASGLAAAAGLHRWLHILKAPFCPSGTFLLGVPVPADGLVVLPGRIVGLMTGSLGRGPADRHRVLALGPQPAPGGLAGHGERRPDRGG